MAAQSIEKLSALPHEKLARLVIYERPLIFDRPHRHKSHRGPRDSLANCRRIGRIVFLPADVGLHIGRRHQSGIMAKFDQLARPTVGRTTGFQSDEAMGRKAAKERQDLLATQGFGDDHAPVVIDRVDLEYVLCQQRLRTKDQLQFCP